MGVPGERMTENSYATLSWHQPPVKFKAEKKKKKKNIENYLIFQENAGSSTISEPRNLHHVENYWGKIPSNLR